MDCEDDLTLPEENFEEDPKSSFGEVREMDEDKKKILKKQKEFEFNEIEGEEERKKEEKKEEKKQKIVKWVVVFFAVLFLILLYFWLIF